MNAGAACCREIALRPATAADRDFLGEVYASTRREELAEVPWPDEAKAAFLRQQFEAQDAYYREQYPEAARHVILADGAPAGRLYVARLAGEIRVVEIALLPLYRGQGVGGRFMEDVLREARERRLPVRLHVERFSRARGLYRRLGFRDVGENGVYVLMQWWPDGQLNTAS